MTHYEQLDAWVDAHFDAQVQFLQELIRVPTDTPPGNKRAACRAHRSPAGRDGLGTRKIPGAIY